jgi:hypothetical protein
MTVFVVMIGIVIGLVLFVFASIGMWGCIVALSSRGRRHGELADQARDVEAHIADINRRAQEAIVTEALSRLRSRQGGRSW